MKCKKNSSLWNICLLLSRDPFRSSRLVGWISFSWLLRSAVVHNDRGWGFRALLWFLVACQERKHTCGFPFVLKCTKAYIISSNVWAQMFILLSIIVLAQTHAETLVNKIALLFIWKWRSPLAFIITFDLCWFFCTCRAQITLYSSCEMINLKMRSPECRNTHLISSNRISEKLVQVMLLVDVNVQTKHHDLLWSTSLWLHSCHTCYERREGRRGGAPLRI